MLDTHLQVEEQGSDVTPRPRVDSHANCVIRAIVGADTVIKRHGRYDMNARAINYC